MTTKGKKKAESDTIATNRKGRHDFEIVESLEAGIALRGTEVKSLRAGHVNLSGAFARVDRDEVWLHGCSIQPYERASFESHDSRRPRKLLLHRKEIIKLSSQMNEKGLTLIALKVYWKGRRVKIEIGVGKGKANRDRREDLKKQVENREAARAIANFNRQ
ncbi:MAG: SsrA-binding protein [Verrucomicrobiales bacterium]|jgi:SsrA-binding protein